MRGPVKDYRIARTRPVKAAVSGKEEGIDAPEKEAYHRALARAIKGRVRIPVELVGCFCTAGALEAILHAGEADFFSMVRVLIREPGLVKR